MKLGAHVSITGGYSKALEKIVKMGGNCLQIFSASPRGWNFPTVSDKDIQQFTHLKKRLSIGPVYFHASYLINLADASKVGTFSKNILINELTLAPKLGVSGSIIHLGSFKESLTPDLFGKNEKYTTLIKNISEILEAIPSNVFFIIENAGTRKIGQSVEEIAQIVNDLKDKRVRICLDTCHLHAAGYNLTTKKSFQEFLEHFDEKVGLFRLELLHINESKDPLGSSRDRHTNLGNGTIGLDVFKSLLTNPKTKNLPFIIETPGFDNKGPDKKNLDILKELIHSTQ